MFDRSGICYINWYYGMNGFWEYCIAWRGRFYVDDLHNVGNKL